jgi:hypothetical protein
VIGSQLGSKLASRNHLLGSSAIHVGLIENNVGSHVCWPGGQHLLLAVNQIAGVEGGQLKTVTVRNGVRGASLDAIAAKNAAVVIDVVDPGVALCAADAVFGGVVGCLDIDAVRRAVGGAEKTSDAFFQAVFVALQDVSAAETGFKPGAAERTFAVGIIFDGRRLEHLHKGDAHAFGNGRDILQNRHTSPVYRKR